MYKKLLLGAISLFFASHALAQSYQFEGNLNYLDGNKEMADGYDIQAVTASGVYYFSPVQIDDHPLQEAAFLEKNSAVSLAYFNAKSTFNFVIDYISDRAEFYIRDKNSSAIIAAETFVLGDILYVGGFLAHDQLDKLRNHKEIHVNDPQRNTTYTTTENDTNDYWRLNVGVAPIAGLLVWSELEKDIDVSQSWNLNAKYVMEFNGGALNLQCGIAKNASPVMFVLPIASIYPSSMKINFNGFDSNDADRVKSAYLLGDYYFNNTLSLGFGVSHVELDHLYNYTIYFDDENIDDSYLVRAKKFFTDKISVQLDYLKTEARDIYSVSASMRF